MAERIKEHRAKVRGFVIGAGAAQTMMNLHGILPGLVLACGFSGHGFGIAPIRAVPGGLEGWRRSMSGKALLFCFLF